MSSTLSLSSEEEELAVEGYQFYADEAAKFAAASGQAASEAWESVEENWLSLAIDKVSP